MKCRIVEGQNGHFRVFIVCDNCRKLIKQYRYDGTGLKLKDTAKILDDCKRKMQKADLSYCVHCGNKNFKDGA